MQSHLNENENIIHNVQGKFISDTRFDALESIRQHFDAGLSNYQGKH